MSWNGGGRGGGGGRPWHGGYGQQEESSDSSPPDTVTISSPPPGTPTPSPQPTPSSISTDTAPNLTPDTSLVTTSLLITTTLSHSGETRAETQVLTKINVITTYSTHNPSPTSPATGDDASETVTVLVTESADPATESAFVSTQPKSQPNLGAIIGGTVGGVLALILLITLLLCLRQRRRVVASSDSRSATQVPFFAKRMLTSVHSDESSLPSPRMRQPSIPDSEVSGQDPFNRPTHGQPMQERLYVLVDPMTLMPQGSVAPLRTSSRGESASFSERYTFSEGWSRANPGFPQDDLPLSPRGSTLSSISFAAPQEQGSHDVPTTLTLVPISHLGHVNGGKHPPSELRDSRP